MAQHQRRSGPKVVWLTLGALALANGIASSTIETGEQNEADEVASSLISDLLRNDDNGNFTPGPLMRRVMEIDEQTTVPPQVDPAAYIELSDEVKGKLGYTLKRIAAEDGPEARNRTNADYPLQVALARGQADLMRALESYRTDKVDKPAIRMGASGSMGSSLGADINNYAPDNFGVDEVDRLFELSDELRQKLANDAIEATGEPIVEMTELKEVNTRVLNSYIKALAGIKLVSEHKPARADDECAICRDNPESEPWVRLPCGHAYHRECTVRWARAQDARANSCPECRRPFRLPFGLSEFP